MFNANETTPAQLWKIIGTSKNGPIREIVAERDYDEFDSDMVEFIAATVAALPQEPVSNSPAEDDNIK
jgi:hypothetical protein